MTSRHRFAAPILAAVFLAVAGAAQAAPITRTYDFNASGFSGGAPTDPVIGSVTVTFDPMGGDVIDQTTDITLNSLNIALDNAIAFRFLSGLNRLDIGGISVGGLVNNDFFLGITNPESAMPTTTAFEYTTTGVSSAFRSSNLNLTVTFEDLPEPAAITLFGFGLAGLGVALRRRRNR